MVLEICSDYRSYDRHYSDSLCLGNSKGESRDSKGISKLPQIKLILPYKVSWIEGSSEIHLISLLEAFTNPELITKLHPDATHNSEENANYMNNNKQ